MINLDIFWQAYDILVFFMLWFVWRLAGFNISQGYIFLWYYTELVCLESRIVWINNWIIITLTLWSVYLQICLYSLSLRKMCHYHENVFFFKNKNHYNLAAKLIVGYVQNLSVCWYSGRRLRVISAYLHALNRWESWWIIAIDAITDLGMNLLLV